MLAFHVVTVSGLIREVTCQQVSRAHVHPGPAEHLTASPLDGGTDYAAAVPEEDRLPWPPLPGASIAQQRAGDPVSTWGQKCWEATCQGQQARNEQSQGQNPRPRDAPPGNNCDLLSSTTQDTHTPHITHACTPHRHTPHRHTPYAKTHNRHTYTHTIQTHTTCKNTNHTQYTHTHRPDIHYIYHIHTTCINTHCA